MTAPLEVAAAAGEIVSRTATLRASCRFIASGQFPAAIPGHKRIALQQVVALKAVVSRVVNAGLREQVVAELQARGFTGKLNG